MLDFILVTGDRAIFNPTFGKAIVAVRPGILNGTGIPTINKKKICLFGDEKKVIVPGCSYTSPPNITPGTGTLSIQSLAINQKARKVKSKRTAVLLKGTTFTARFQVIVPATTPTVPPEPDTMLVYFGTGFFTTTNRTTKGT
ncbi:hypothetical protein I8752_35455 [Nostocaceae cyanobacterium CENA369]|uniref:Uncharacterized protein n=1 Tax=Dendronalium phyllosphericum CENA369 TaxID=1725256 RepID=A0A8J7IHN8_9NOST|nr:hypothetical protein [Dendronalium phyllosphericum]MBH8578153.1 hypothetical protein [Dendronalium phyllosphericum CENA369]